MDLDSIDRNNYINQSYHEIGKELSQCLGVAGEVGNWYDFAKWTSLSAIRVINKEKYETMKFYRKIELSIAEILELANARRTDRSFRKGRQPHCHRNDYHRSAISQHLL